jgi:RND family efflux transporter MFP subunit
MLFRKKNSVDGAQRRLKMKPLAIGVVVVLALGAVVGFRATQGAKSEQKKEAPPVLEFTPSDVAIVEVRELDRAIAFSGSLMPVVQTTLKSKVPGEVQKVLVREGETVAQGQVMAQIDTTVLQMEIDSRLGALEEAKARLSIAEKNRENNQQLLRQKFISQNAFDTAHSTYEASAAMLRSAEAQVRIAQKAMDDAAVRAPFTGIVAKKMVNPGEKVGVDSPLFALVDLGLMEIEAPAPASEIPSVRVGQPASFRVDGFADRTFEGRVERINPVTEQNSRSITLYISVANRDGVLRGGMFAKGQIVLDTTAPAAVIPATAVRDEAGQTYVFTIEDGKIARRAVKVGVTEAQQGMVEVKSGLETGLQVVSARVSGLKAGAPAIMKAPVLKPAGESNASAPAKAG